MIFTNRYNLCNGCPVSSESQVSIASKFLKKSFTGDTKSQTKRKVLKTKETEVKATHIILYFILYFILQNIIFYQKSISGFLAIFPTPEK